MRFQIKELKASINSLFKGEPDKYEERKKRVADACLSFLEHYNAAEYAKIAAKNTNGANE